jgi:hypothetical protein
MKLLAAEQRTFYIDPRYRAPGIWSYVRTQLWKIGARIVCQYRNVAQGTFDLVKCPIDLVCLSHVGACYGGFDSQQGKRSSCHLKLLDVPSDQSD